MKIFKIFIVAYILRDLIDFINPGRHLQADFLRLSF